MAGFISCYVYLKKYFRILILDQQVYSRIGREMMTVIDVALAAGGTEAVVEGFYSKMKGQMTGPNQSNDSLVQRTIIDWMLPGK